jgi:UDP-2,4-diacetamido-2,4,6-trideoxy-beta-L-altropyranose hydrolase
MQKIYFRADAGAEIGYGHFIRSLALADMLKGYFDCTFFTAEPTPYQIGEMEKVCKYVALEANAKLQSFLDYLKGDEIVVLDNYFYSTDYQKSIKTKGCKLVCIDDLHDKHFVADIVINQAINVTPADYSCEEYTRFAFGSDYWLLRNPFFDANKKATTKRITSSQLKVVIAFGGSDSLDLTGKIIRTVIGIGDVQEVTAIVGDAYSFAKVDSPKAHYVKNLSAQQIADLFISSDVAVLPASTMMNEALVCGIHIIGGYYVPNQENDYYAFLREKMIEGVGDFTSTDSIDKLSQTLKQLDTKQIIVVITGIPRRYVELFKELELS